MIFTVHQAKTQLSKLIASAVAGETVIIAQALLENLTLVSNETIFDASGVSRLW
jgi:hypothetical protein